MTERATRCRNINAYERLNFIDQGTYGVVFRARDRETGNIYALKQVKYMQQGDGFPVTCLREIATLLSIDHPNIVHIHEILTDDTNAIYIAMEYAEHDLYTLLERMQRPYMPSEIKSLILQILRAVSHLHDNWILHRDLKPSNLLLNNRGVVKVCDFGLARLYADPLGKYTQGVVTLWYRAPELLMGARQYSSAVDMWAVGCIFAELILKRPLFEGKGELDQMGKIADMLGAPCEERWDGYDQLPNADRVVFRGGRSSRLRQFLMSGMGRGLVSEAGLDLLESMLLYDPALRIGADEALQHRYFTEAPLAKDPSLIQTFPDDRRGG